MPALAVLTPMQRQAIMNDMMGAGSRSLARGGANLAAGISQFNPMNTAARHASTAQSGYAEQRALGDTKALPGVLSAEDAMRQLAVESQLDQTAMGRGSAMAAGVNYPASNVLFTKFGIRLSDPEAATEEALFGDPQNGSNEGASLTVAPPGEAMGTDPMAPSPEYEAGGRPASAGPRDAVPSPLPPPPPPPSGTFGGRPGTPTVPSGMNPVFIPGLGGMNTRTPPTPMPGPTIAPGAPPAPRVLDAGMPGGPLFGGPPKPSFMASAPPPPAGPAPGFMRPPSPPPTMAQPPAQPFPVRPPQGPPAAPGMPAMKRPPGAAPPGAPLPKGEAPAEVGAKSFFSRTRLDPAVKAKAESLPDGKRRIAANAVDRMGARFGGQPTMAHAISERQADMLTEESPDTIAADQNLLAQIANMDDPGEILYALGDLKTTRGRAEATKMVEGLADARRKGKDEEARFKAHLKAQYGEGSPLVEYEKGKVDWATKKSDEAASIRAQEMERGEVYDPVAKTFRAPKTDKNMKPLSKPGAPGADRKAALAEWAKKTAQLRLLYEGRLQNATNRMEEKFGKMIGGKWNSLYEQKDKDEFEKMDKVRRDLEEKLADLDKIPEGEEGGAPQGMRQMMDRSAELMLKAKTEGLDEDEAEEAEALGVITRRR